MMTETANQSSADPGLTTLVTLLRFNGVGADPGQIRHRFGGSPIGIPEMLRVAKELGLDVDQLQKDAENPDIKKGLDQAKELAQKLNLQGTPLFLIGDRVIPGAPDDLFDQLKASVAEVRQNGCASTC